MSAEYVLQMSFSIQDACSLLYVHWGFFYCIKRYAVLPPLLLDDSDIL